METTEQIEFTGDKPKMISYYEHEVEVARSETHSLRWMIAAIITFIALVVTNAGWIVYENQFEDIQTTVTQEASSDSGDAVINGDKAGAVIYGYSEADSKNEEKSAEDGR